MNTLSLAFAAAWKVLAVSVVLGAGIPAVFALGVRGMAMGNGGLTTKAPANPAGKAIAIVCFALAAAAVAVGLTMIIAAGYGKDVSFSHIYPTIVTPKK